MAGNLARNWHYLRGIFLFGLVSLIATSFVMLFYDRRLAIVGIVTSAFGAWIAILPVLAE